MAPARILIVEDEDVLAENLKVFLSRRTPDVRIARDAVQARLMLETFTPDVVVLEYSLPGIDGLRAYSDIVCDQERHPGCVMITCDTTDRIAATARQRGIRHLLGKPFSFADLQQLVDLSASETGGRFAPDQTTPHIAASPLAHGTVDAETNRRQGERRHRADRRRGNTKPGSPR